MQRICGAIWIVLTAAAVVYAQNDSFEAQATAVTGQVSRIRGAEPWALSSGERVLSFLSGIDFFTPRARRNCPTLAPQATISTIP